MGHIKRRPGLHGSGMLDVPDPYVYFKISTGVVSHVTAQTAVKNNEAHPDWSDETHTLAGLGEEPCTLKCDVYLYDKTPLAMINCCILNGIWLNVRWTAAKSGKEYKRICSIPTQIWFLTTQPVDLVRNMSRSRLIHHQFAKVTSKKNITVF